MPKFSHCIMTTRLPKQSHEAVDYQSLIDICGPPLANASMSFVLKMWSSFNNSIRNSLSESLMRTGKALIMIYIRARKHDYQNLENKELKIKTKVVDKWYSINKKMNMSIFINMPNFQVLWGLARSRFTQESFSSSSAYVPLVRSWSMQLTLSELNILNKHLLESNRRKSRFGWLAIIFRRSSWQKNRLISWSKTENGYRWLKI